MQVLTELPKGVHSTRDSSIPYQEATGYEENGVAVYHYCKRCGGWLKGEPKHERVSDMQMRAGRQGTAYFCGNGHEIAFEGAVS